MPPDPNSADRPTEVPHAEPAALSYRLALAGMGCCFATIGFAVLAYQTGGLTAFLMIICLLLAPCLGLAAVITGIAAYVRIRRSGGNLTGLPKARISCIGGFFTLLLSLLLFAIFGNPNPPRSRDTAQQNACIATLKQIEGAKEQWALDLKKAPSDTPMIGDLCGPTNYLKTMPTCPAGGVYILGRMNVPPTCNIKGHTL